MKALAALAGALVLGTGAALADGGITVKLPDVSNLSDTEAKSLIAELANVNVITSNCLITRSRTGNGR